MIHFSYPFDFSDFSSDEAERIIELITDWKNDVSEFTFQSSGSTGKPKKLAFTREQLFASILKTKQFFGLEKSDNALICLPIDYIAGKMMWLRSQEIGMNVTYLTPSSNPLENTDLKNPIDFAAFVPLQLQLIIEKSPEKLTLLNNAKAILVGGGQISNHQNELFQQIKAPIFHTYGMTETVSHIAVKRINGNDQSSSYQTLPLVEIDSTGNDCLRICADVTNNEWITTTDRVELLSPTSFNWLGRMDHVINSGGVKIQLEEVEQKLQNLFDEASITNRFFLFGKDNIMLGQKLCLVIEGKVNHPTLKEILESFEKFEKPKAAFSVPLFIETASAKINRKETIKEYSL
ncbi:MAG: AMP-binding protein [Cyclobacteriaceae bacterium]